MTMPGSSELVELRARLEQVLARLDALEKDVARLARAAAFAPQEVTPERATRVEEALVEEQAGRRKRHGS
jgi:hypothetical protein